MVRVTNAPARKRRVKRLLKEAKGFWGDRKNHYSNAKDALVRAWDHAYRGRKKKKSEFRGIWIQRINAVARAHGISYSKLIAGLARAKIDMNRKVLADLAVEDPKAFGMIVEQAKKALV